MTAIDRAEATLDDAHSRKDKLQAAISAAQDDIRNALRRVQEAGGATDRQRAQCLDDILQAIDGMTEDAMAALDSEIDEATYELSDAEEHDLHRSSPVVI